MSSFILINVSSLVVLILASVTTIHGKTTNNAAPAQNHYPRPVAPIQQHYPAQHPYPPPSQHQYPQYPPYQPKPNVVQIFTHGPGNKTKPSCNCPPPMEPRCQWKRVFKAVSGSGRDVYNDWSSGLSMNENNAAAKEVESDLEFRDSSILDNWENRDIEKVKIEIYNEGVVMNRIVFNGISSDMNSWMSQDRVIASPYSDVKDGTFMFFSTAGDDRPAVRRSFYIQRTYAGCMLDCGYLLVTGTTGSCPTYENLQPIPAFYYGKESQCSIWDEAGQRGSGDRFLISVLDCSVEG